MYEKTDSRKMLIVSGGRTPDSYGVVCNTKKWPKIKKNEKSLWIFKSVQNVQVQKSIE
jgi:hypothetical protein